MTIFGPHHDGSARHVSDLEPALGDTVSVWLRVPHAAPASRVWARSVPDGEPHYVEAVVDRRTDHETWWRADVELHNPLTNYRFLLDGGRAGQRTVNGTGVHQRTVSDAHDFRISTHAAPPSWVADTVFYEVFIDRFAHSDAVRTWPQWASIRAWDEPVSLDGRVAVTQVYGGDLPGLASRLDYLAALGATGLYLTPFFPAPSSHRYNADRFDRVDPLLGGDDALVALVTACHRRGIRVIGDLTINHSGDRHEWFRAAQADATSAEAGFYFFRDHPGDYEAWFDIPTLPKFDLRDPELQRRLLSGDDSVTATWLRPPFDLDGWRVDVANMAGRQRDVDANHAAAVAMRQAMAAARPDAYLVAEHGYDATRDLDGDGWHGVMNYLAFTRPVWCWLRGDDEHLKFLGDPLPVPRFGGAATVAAMREVAAGAPWRQIAAGFDLLGSHDTTRFRTVCGTTGRQLAGAGLLFTMPAVPMVFAGDELGLTGVDGDGARQPMPWDHEASWDREVLDGYRRLSALRGSSEALRRGGLRWLHAGDDVLVYLRESHDERLLVQVSRGDHHPVRLPARTLDGAVGASRFGGVDPARDADEVVLPATGAGTHVWELER